MRLLIWLGIALVGSLLGFFITKSHKVVRKYFSFNVALRLTNATLIKEAVLVVAVLTHLVQFSSIRYAFLAILTDFILTEGLLLYLRVMISRFRSSTSQNVSANAFKQTALIVGTDDKAIQLSNRLISNGAYDFQGFVTVNPEMQGKIINDKIVYLCRSQKDLDNLMWRLGGIDCLMFTNGAGMPLEEMSKSEELKEAETNDHAQNASIQKDGMSAFGHFVKRSFDVILSGVLLVLFSPLMLISAIAVKRGDGGPAIYSQERLGRNGKPFQIYKFRSMCMDAEASGKPALYGGDDDERLTPVGRFLRQHHLDELPQLWNVFKGDMSFIGYRPERKYFIEQIMQGNPRYRYLFQIRPGVTSYATLYNGYTDTYEKMLTRLDLDLYYLRNHSILFDLKVLWLTFLNIVVGKRF